MSFLFNHCTFKKLDKNLSGFTTFKCADKDLNDFFLNDFEAYSKDLFGKSYCFVTDDDSGDIVCAFTVSNDSLKTKTLPNKAKNKVSRKVSNPKRTLKSYPSVLIGRLGVSLKYEKKGIGSELVDFIKAWFSDTNNKTGCRFLVVDAYNNETTLGFYKKNGFKFLFEMEIEEQEFTGENDFLKTRLMFFDLIQLTQ